MGHEARGGGLVEQHKGTPLSEREPSSMELVYLYRLVDGKSCTSYGYQCAEQAGLDQSMMEIKVAALACFWTAPFEDEEEGPARRPRMTGRMGWREVGSYLGGEHWMGRAAERARGAGAAGVEAAPQQRAHRAPRARARGLLPAARRRPGGAAPPLRRSHRRRLRLPAGSSLPRTPPPSLSASHPFPTEPCGGMQRPVPTGSLAVCGAMALRWGMVRRRWPTRGSSRERRLAAAHSSASALRVNSSPVFNGAETTLQKQSTRKHIAAASRTGTGAACVWFRASVVKVRQQWRCCLTTLSRCKHQPPSVPGIAHPVRRQVAVFTCLLSGFLSRSCLPHARAAPG
eukprot:3934119-Rhodomonas_salina.1